MLIRHPLTKMFRREDGSWTKRPEEAQAFEGTTQAVNVCLKNKLDAYEILMPHPKDPQYDVVILEQRPSGPGETSQMGEVPG